MLASEPNRLEAAQPSPDAEAARYALLRRLAPSMRHHLVVNLQPIGMIYEVMERRLRVPQPDLAHVQESATKINTFARAALASCLDVVGWLAPDEAVGIPLQEGARECSSLLATSLGFRGYALRNEVGAITRQVRRSALRSLLTGTLIHSADHLKPPAELVLAAVAQEGGVEIGVTTRPTDGDKGFANEPNYRKIEWRDLQALAAAEGVQLAREGARITLRLPWVDS
ncbi:MAG: hypothetical protein JWQ76_2777 [Ramlibacter sp.]|nr:hypothetical protein [Ramlibacter sp.]